MRVIGLISGTSVDGIDAAVVDITGENLEVTVHVQASATYPYPSGLRDQILSLCGGAPQSLETIAQIDDAVAQVFAQAALRIQTEISDSCPIDLIGSHGQTVFHRPPKATETGLQLGYSWQLGRGEVIAQLTQIPTVSHFRQADLALGGHGAPLVPRVDLALLGHPEKSRCIQNLGGIGNVTYLPGQASANPDSLGDGVWGWDTGPGNVLLDLAVTHFSQGQLTYDAEGAWAARGTVNQAILQAWLTHPYFSAPPPKSTGRELFGLDYWQQCLADFQAHNPSINPADVLATLTELTAAAIAQNYQQFLPQMPDQVFLCGGGALNPYLRSRIGAWLAPIPVGTTTELGVPIESKEALAFAVLAYWKYHGWPGNLPSVTGATAAIPLGILHLPR